MGQAKQDFKRHRPHPWHGIEPVVEEPDTVRGFIEVTQYDRIKFEMDPVTGYLSVDRPQRNSSLPPNPYGFIPRTLCGRRTGGFMKRGTPGDGDALDIVILSEHEMTRAEVVLDARIIGAIETLDHDKADPKIIAVLKGDLLWGDFQELKEVPGRQVERLEHYFRQYKVEKGHENPVAVVDHCNREKAIELFSRSRGDYSEAFEQQETR
ncbi:MAG: inorganic diphosphatase [Puniceicoccaceae bacterium]